MANVPNEFNCAPLYWAIVRDDTEVVRSLLESRADPNLPCRNGLTAIHAAAAHGTETTLTLLMHYAGNIHVRSKNQSSVLHSVAYRIRNGDHRWSMIDFLVKKGIDPLAKDDRDQTARDILDGLDWSYAELYDNYLEACLQELWDTLTEATGPWPPNVAELVVMYDPVAFGIVASLLHTNELEPQLDFTLKCPKCDAVCARERCAHHILFTCPNPSRILNLVSQVPE